MSRIQYDIKVTSNRDSNDPISTLSFLPGNRAVTANRKHKPAEQRSSGRMSARPLAKKGSSIPNDVHEIAAPERQVVLRMPRNILDQVDNAVRQRVVRIPRHTWLLEAIVEKLDHEATQGDNGHGAE